MASKIFEEDESVKKIRASVGMDVPEIDILKALSKAYNDEDEAIKIILESPGFVNPFVKRTSSGGARISTQVKQEVFGVPIQSSNFADLKSGSIDVKDEKFKVKDEKSGSIDVKDEKFKVKDEKFDVGSEEISKVDDLRLGLDHPMVDLKVGIENKENLEEKIGDLKEKSQSVDRMEVDSNLGFEKREKMEVELQSVDRMKVESNIGIEKAAVMEGPASSGKCEQSNVGEQLDCQKESSDLIMEDKGLVKKEPLSLDDCEPLKSKIETINEWKGDSNVVDRKNAIIKAEPLNSYESSAAKRKKDSISSNEDTKLGFKKKGSVKEEPVDLDEYQPKKVKREPEVVVCDELTGLKSNYFSSYNHKVKQETEAGKVLGPRDVEDGEFPDETDWVLVGRSTVTGLSTCRGKKLDFNEIVHFAFPATSKIVRFSTKRAGEIGRLPIEWTNCIIPLVKASKVKVCARCVAAPLKLSVMQEIHLYASFYIHHSIFTEGDKSSWNLSSPSHIDLSLHPLSTLFKLLKITPFQKAEFTPEELDSRKRPLSSRGSSEGDKSLRSLAKRRNVYAEQQPDEQVVSESTLNKLVGAADVYDLKEMDPPNALTCVLHSYQKQALFWMSESEKGIDVEQAAKTLHPCWEAYRLTDKKASAVYVNVFSGEATTRFPSATKIAKGGILADAMGLGKTVMTIALILARPRKNASEKDLSKECKQESLGGKQNKKQSQAMSLQTVKGGTLIVCPMALLGQWKDELDTHSKPGSLQVYVQYGVDRSANPATLAENDVVLTTYGVLAAAYKSDGDASIFHKVEWFRVVLDEAHTIKSSKTQVAQAAFALAAHCRWCLTGTPIQNNLEDLYSLLCFLHVEPWCNWVWWQKLIQKPYELGDPRAMRLIKSILRQMMLRRTKDTKDKEGRPILVLPPTDIQLIECKQSVAERDFYDALFKRSKVQFDQYVSQGKVLHNYANILELLLRLRQCCNHPYLVMSRADCTKYTDLNKLARQFLETTSKAAATPAYIDEVVEGIRNGENSECPICLESADDPVLTPCAHRICRECLLSSWRSSTGGLCPICRQHVMRNELITCPSDNQFRVDYENNWKESAKVSKLLECLEKLHAKGCGEKSIVFSQWTSFFDLLQIPLNKHGIKFLRFDGKLSQRNREIVLKEFNEGKDKMVLLMSLKAGGVGLNLTAASNVFLMDPWWNPAVEEQAIMRIHRIGQKRTVCVRRFIVKDTVEERMQQVQARKERMIAGALTDGEVRTARIEELKMLFR